MNKQSRRLETEKSIFVKFNYNNTYNRYFILEMFFIFIIVLTLLTGIILNHFYYSKEIQIICNNLKNNIGIICTIQVLSIPTLFSIVSIKLNKGYEKNYSIYIKDFFYTILPKFLKLKIVLIINVLLIIVNLILLCFNALILIIFTNTLISILLIFYYVLNYCYTVFSDNLKTTLFIKHYLEKIIEKISNNIEKKKYNKKNKKFLYNYIDQLTMDIINVTMENDYDEFKLDIKMLFTIYKNLLKSYSIYNISKNKLVEPSILVYFKYRLNIVFSFILDNRQYYYFLQAYLCLINYIKDIYPQFINNNWEKDSDRNKYNKQYLFIKRFQDVYIWIQYNVFLNNHEIIAYNEIFNKTTNICPNFEKYLQEDFT